MSGCLSHTALVRLCRLAAGTELTNFGAGWGGEGGQLRRWATGGKVGKIRPPIGPLRGSTASRPRALPREDRSQGTFCFPVPAPTCPPPPLLVLDRLEQYVWWCGGDGQPHSHARQPDSGIGLCSLCRYLKQSRMRGKLGAVGSDLDFPHRLLSAYRPTDSARVTTWCWSILGAVGTERIFLRRERPFATRQLAAGT